MKTKRTILIGAAGIILIIIVLIYSVISGKIRTNEKVISDNERVTRFQWIQMLTESFGMMEYSNETPYFEDVSLDSPYFAAVQVAYEWGLLEESSNFKGDDSADGRFTILTAMRAIGKYKIQIYMGLSDLPDDDDYIRLAIEERLIEQTELEEAISIQKSEEILKQVNHLYRSALWIDDLVNYNYKEDVREIDSDAIIAVSEDRSRFMVSDKILKDLNVDDVVVFSVSNGKEKIAGRISEIGVDGTVKISSEILLGQVYDSFVISDMVAVTFEDIVEYYGFDEDDLVMVDHEVVPVSRSEVKEASVGGISFGLEASDGKLKIVVTDSETGMGYALPINKIDSEIEISGTIDFKRIEIGSQIVYKEGALGNIEIPEYMHVQLNSGFSFLGNVFAESGVEEIIPFMVVPVRLGAGAVTIELQLYFVIGLDGSIEVEAGIPVQAGVEYREGKTSLYASCSEAEIDYTANCTSSLLLRMEPLLKVAYIPIIEMQFDPGITAEGVLIDRDGSNINKCIDVEVAAPIFTISVSGNDDINTLADKMGLEVEVFILTSKNAPFHMSSHGEWHQNGEYYFVDQCTYSADKESVEKKTYRTRWNDITMLGDTFLFDYPSNWTITEEVVEDYATIAERVTLVNENGLEIRYMNYGTLGGFGRFMWEVEIRKVADSHFIPTYPAECDIDYSFLGDFMVAEVKIVGELFMDTDSDYQKTDGSTFYAVMPEAREGRYSDVRSIIQECSFEYVPNYVFIASAPEGEFSKEEKAEVIEILSSFRLE